MAWKKKTQIYIRMKNFGLAYFKSIDIDNEALFRWQNNLLGYMEERERYDKWVSMFGTDEYITVVFHSDYFSGRNLVAAAHHLLSMATKLVRSDINPFLPDNWEYGSCQLPGSCVYNDPMTGIQFLHSYLSGMFSSPLCSAEMPFFTLVNKEIYDDCMESSSRSMDVEKKDSVEIRFNACNELDNNDGILLLDFTALTPGYCFMFTDTFDPTTAVYEMPKYVPVDARNYMLAFHPEHETNLTVDKLRANAENVKNNRPYVKAMKDFVVMREHHILDWFPDMKSAFLNKSIAAGTEVKIVQGPKIPLEFIDYMAESTDPLPAEELSKVKKGTLVKISAIIPDLIAAQLRDVRPGFESFWVEVTSVDKDKMTGKIQSMVQYVGYTCGDEITFQQRNVYQIR